VLIADADHDAFVVIQALSWVCHKCFDVARVRDDFENSRYNNTFTKADNFDTGGDLHHDQSLKRQA
jgi:hypothetical protein